MMNDESWVMRKTEFTSITYHPSLEKEAAFVARADESGLSFGLRF
jgi:hypothetical protein